MNLRDAGRRTGKSDHQTGGKKKFWGAGDDDAGRGVGFEASVKERATRPRAKSIHGRRLGGRVPCSGASVCVRVCARVVRSAGTSFPMQVGKVESALGSRGEPVRRSDWLRFSDVSRARRARPLASPARAQTLRARHVVRWMRVRGS